MPLSAEAITALKSSCKLVKKRPLKFFYCVAGEDGDPVLIIGKTIANEVKDLKKTAKKKKFVKGTVVRENNKLQFITETPTANKFAKNLKTFFGAKLPDLKKAEVKAPEVEGEAETPEAEGEAPPPPAPPLDLPGQEPPTIVAARGPSRRAPAPPPPPAPAPPPPPKKTKEEIADLRGALLGKIEDLRRNIIQGDLNGGMIIHPGAFPGGRGLYNYMVELIGGGGGPVPAPVIEWVKDNYDALKQVTGQAPPARRNTRLGLDILASDDLDPAALKQWFAANRDEIKQFVYGDAELM